MEKASRRGNPRLAEKLHCPVRVGLYRGSMQSADLTPDQAKALKRQIRQMLSYLRRLTQRMNRRRFPSDDPLFRSAYQR